MSSRPPTDKNIAPVTAHGDVSLLTEVLQAFEQPAYLVSPRGTLVFANEAARASFATPPSWVSRYAVLEAGHGAPAAARRVQIPRGRSHLWLVTAPLDRAASGATDWSKFQLGPSLAQIAELVAQGLKDKDIVSITGRPLATVRAYVARVYKRVGVRSRVELVMLVQRLRAEPSQDSS